LVLGSSSGAYDTHGYTVANRGSQSSPKTETLEGIDHIRHWRERPSSKSAH